MTIVEKYIEHVKEGAENGDKHSFEKMVLGFKANELRMKILPNRKLSKGYQKLEHMMMSLVADSLRKQHSYVWGNIFAPCEMLFPLNLRMLSVECLACYFSGFHLESYFIDFAQSRGIAPTLCSYHKTFVGAVESGTVECPDYAVTTSLSCDGNLNTFRYLEKKLGVPFTFLDVPYSDDKASVDYLEAQLKDMADSLSDKLGRKPEEEKLKEIIQIENETHKEIKKFFHFETEYYYPGELTSQLYLMMAVHLMIGTPELLELFKFMNEDIQTYPKLTGKKIIWSHMIPYYQESLKEYFNENPDYQIIASDIVLDYAEEMDAERPYRALAKKIIRNLYNGTYDYKAQTLGKIVREVEPDGLIHFCHWGCKQSSGGSILLKEKMQELNVPMLILDGDGIDKRNSHDGQIKTRLEAFLEMLDQRDEERKRIC